MSSLAHVAVIAKDLVARRIPLLPQPPVEPGSCSCDLSVCCASPVYMVDRQEFQGSFSTTGAARPSVSFDGSHTDPTVTHTRIFSSSFPMLFPLLLELRQASFMVRPVFSSSGHVPLVSMLLLASVVTFLPVSLEIRVIVIAVALILTVVRASFLGILIGHGSILYQQDPDYNPNQVAGGTGNGP